MLPRVKNIKMENMRLASGSSIADFRPMFETFFQVGFEAGRKIGETAQGMSEEQITAISKGAFDMILNVAEISLGESFEK
jgi:hypothetical protein